MKANETLIQAIISFIFGRKYYANIINTKGVSKCEISSFIFASKDDARKHQKDIESTHTYSYVETVSFRSRKEYEQLSNK